MKTILTLSILFLFIMNLNAQPYGPQFPTPIGFVEILIGAGAVLGSKKIYEAQREKKK